MYPKLQNRIKYISLITALLISLGIFSYVFLFDKALVTIADELATGELAKESALQDLSSIPVESLLETDTAFVIEDAKENMGVRIEYQNQEENKLADAHEIEKLGNFRIEFSKDYSQGTEVDLGEGKMFLMRDVNGDDFFSSVILDKERSDEDPESRTEEGIAINNIRQSNEILGSLASVSLQPEPQDDKGGKYVKYQSKDKRKKIYYAYQKDSATGERKLKKWIVYEYAQNTSTEHEQYQFENAKLQKNDNGDVEIFYWGDREKQNELTMAEVDEGLLARAQRVLARDMGEDFMKNGQPDLIIPKPFYYDKDNNIHYLEWEVSDDGYILSLEFEVEESQYPIALDPTLEFTAPGISESSDVITGEGLGDAFGYSLATGDLNADGKDDLVVGTRAYNSNQGRVYIFYQDEGLGDKAYMADEVIAGESSSYFGNFLIVEDLNTDGKEDLVVGAPIYDTSIGRVYIFYNNDSYSNTASTADEIITGEFSSGYFGFSLAVGDLNNDGKKDLVVGGSAYSSGRGRVYVFYNNGSYPVLASGADIKITGESAGDNFGTSIVTEDMNLDGITDLIVAAPLYNSQQGRVYIYTNETKAVSGYQKEEMRGDVQFRGDVIIK